MTRVRRNAAIGPHVALVTLGVRDLSRARAFYVDGLGWQPTLELPEIVFIQVGHGLLLALFGVDDLDEDRGDGRSSGPAGDAPFTLAHNVATEAAVDEAVAAAVAAGARLVKEPQRAAWGGYHAYVADPDGFVWEVAANAGLTVAADGTVVFATPD